jgi:hypothetical protein
VRYYDRAALARLAYVLLWRFDGMLSVEYTTAIVASANGQHRNELIERCRDELDDRITRLGRARGTLDHMLNCSEDDPIRCAVGGGRIRRQVDVALDRLND